MMHDSSLTTVALLSAFTQNGNRHYLDLLLPFIKYCLPDSVGSIVDFDKVSQRLDIEFGISEMPTHLIKAIVKRYSERDQHPIVAKQGESFVICQQKENVEFDNRRRTIRLQMEDVSKKLDEFYSRNPWKKPNKTSKELLLSFFQKYGMTVVNKVDELNLITPINDSEIFGVAKFILWAAEEDISLFSSLVDLTKGFLTYRAIYQIDEGDKRDLSSKLRNVKCFLDCSLIVSLMGFDTDASQKSIESLISLLRRNGGQLFTFAHTIDEARNLLFSYANSPDKLRYKLPGIKNKKYSDSTVRAKAANLELSIKEKGVRVFEVSKEQVDKHREGASELLKVLRDQPGNGNRSDYDFSSIIGIRELRNHSHPYMIEDCKAILITQDIRLAHGITKVSGSRNGEISLAKLDTDIVSLLWLQSFESCPNVPKDILLSNAAAAVSLSDEVRERAIELTDAWIKEGSVNSSMARLIRSDQLDEYFLADQTANDPEAFDFEMAKQAVREMFADDFDAQREDLVAEFSANNEATIEEIRTQHDLELEKARQTAAKKLEEKEKEYAQKASKDQQQQEITRLRNVDRKAAQRSHTLRTILKWIAFSIMLASLFALIAYQVIDMISVFNPPADQPVQIPTWKWILHIMLILVTAYGTISVFFDAKIAIGRLLNSFERWIYKKLWSYYDRVSREFNKAI